MKEVEAQEKYYLLRKNNGLQTIESLINPFVYVSKDKQEVLRIKKELELKFLRLWPIDYHFDHHDLSCDEEMINFDSYLLKDHGFSFLLDGFDHSQKELNGQIQYGKEFPSELTDSDLLAIQQKMNKYHFDLIEQVPNGKSIIVINPWDFENPLRDGEISKLTEYYDSNSKAKKFIDTLVEALFDIDGTYMLVGHIDENNLTEKTYAILNSQVDFSYKSRKFSADKDLSEIINGMNTLMQLFESVDKTPYEIVALN